MAQERMPYPSLFSWVVEQHLDPEHPLLVLSGKIGWKWIDLLLAPYYANSGTGCSLKPTCLMVGLMILKHRFDLSDAEVVQGLHENVVDCFLRCAAWSGKWFNGDEARCVLQRVQIT